MYATSVQPSEYNPVDYAVGGSTSNIPQEVRENGNMQLNDEAVSRTLTVMSMLIPFSACLLIR